MVQQPRLKSASITTLYSRTQSLLMFFSEASLPVQPRSVTPHTPTHTNRGDWLSTLLVKGRGIFKKRTEGHRIYPNNLRLGKSWAPWRCFFFARKLRNIESSPWHHTERLNPVCLSWFHDLNDLLAPSQNVIHSSLSFFAEIKHEMEGPVQWSKCPPTAGQRGHCFQPNYFSIEDSGYHRQCNRNTESWFCHD